MEEAVSTVADEMVRNDEIGCLDAALKSEMTEKTKISSLAAAYELKLNKKISEKPAV